MFHLISSQILQFNHCSPTIYRHWLLLLVLSAVCLAHMTLKIKFSKTKDTLSFDPLSDVDRLISNTCLDLWMLIHNTLQNESETTMDGTLWRRHVAWCNTFGFILRRNIMISLKGTFAQQWNGGRRRINKRWFVKSIMVLAPQHKEFDEIHNDRVTFRLLTDWR